MHGWNAWGKSQPYLSGERTGVETLLRLPSSARLTNPPCTEEFSIAEDDQLQLQVEFPQTEGQPAGNVWKRWPPCSANGETHVRHVHQMRRRVSSCLIEREGQSAGGSRGFCLSLVCRRGGNDCEQHSSLQHQHKSSLITALKHRGYQHQHHQPKKSFTSLSEYVSVYCRCWRQRKTCCFGLWKHI